MKKEIFTISNGQQAAHTTTFEGKALTYIFMYVFVSFKKRIVVKSNLCGQLKLVYDFYFDSLMKV